MSARRQRTFRWAGFVAASSIVTAVLVGPAAAQPAFRLGPDRWFAAGNPFTDPIRVFDSAALNARGAAIVAGSGERWGIPPPPVWTHTPIVRERNGARGRWSGVISLARPASDVTVPSVALNATGSGLAVFRRAGRYLSARRGPDGRWRLTGPVAPASGSDQVAVTLTNGGRAIVALTRTVAGCDPHVAAACAWVVEVFAQRAATTRWSPVGDALALPAVKRLPIVSMSRRGDLLVAWAVDAPGQVLAARRLVADAGFEAPQIVASAGVLSGGAIGDRGDAAVGLGGKVARRPAGSATWGTPQQLVADSACMPCVSVAVDADGNTAAAWNEWGAGGPGTQTQMAAYQAAVAASWEISLLSTGGTDQTVGIDRVLVEDGRVFVVWEHMDQAVSREVILAVRNPATGAWAAAGELPGGELPDAGLASAPNGRLISVAPGLHIRNYDPLVTPPVPRVIAARAEGAGHVVSVTFRLSVGSHVYIRQTGSSTRNYPVKLLRAGIHRLRLGPIPRGTYNLAISACNATSGCGFSGAHLRFTVP